MAAGAGGRGAVGQAGGAAAAVLTWEELQEKERRRFTRRREWLRRNDPDLALPAHAVGLALSGGGIRSATFSLGVLRGLSRLRLLPKIDYLSTVSGGGYAGSFYCSLFVPRSLRGSVPDDGALDVEGQAEARARALGPDALGGKIGRRAVGQLRQGGHFLNPNGTSDALFAGVVAVRNWIAVTLVTGLAIISLALIAHLPRMEPGGLRNIAQRPAAEAEPARREAPAAVKARAEASPPIPTVNCAADVRPQNGDVAARCTISPPEAPPAPKAPGADIGPPIGASWLWLLAILPLPLWVVPSGWAYWFTRTGRNIPRSRLARLASPPALVAFTSALLAGGIWIYLEFRGDWTWGHHAFLATVVTGAIGGILYYIAAEKVTAGEERGAEPTTTTATDDAALVAEEDRVRTKLSRWLFRGVFVSFAFAVAALTDDAGRLVYHVAGPVDIGALDTTTGIFGFLATAAAFAARWILKRVQGVQLLNWPKLSVWLRRFGRTAALIVGVLILFALMTAWTALSYAIFWHGEPVTLTGENGWPALLGSRWILPLVITLFILYCAVALGRVHSFLNQSSLASFYAGRLRKAYLGASNDDRTGAHVPPDVELPTDDIQLGAYFREEILAPVHLINVTINETTSASSRVIQRDRKGKGMAITPAGYTFTEGAPSDPPIGFLLSGGEQLPLSTWMGISGAAFSTGMGQHTSLGTSLLAGMTNLRLGYWWESPYPGRWHSREATSGGARALRQVNDSRDDLVQTYILRELRASFEGTHSNRWYLSDGGHFENMGVYELVRRQVPFIIACDNGADPQYEFADFVNMVRKIRIDFDAETELLSNEDLDRLLGTDSPIRSVFGTLEDMEPKEAGEKVRSGPYAALARIRYLSDGDGTKCSTLLVIKPRVTGAELPDLLRYKKSDVAFPQQPTTDLFFDEAQWESYYRLGQLIAEAVFDEDRAPLQPEPSPGRWGRGKPPRPWRPIDLQPLR